MCVCFVCMKFIRRKKVGVGSPGTVDTDSCELPCVCWYPNPGPLQEQQALLAAGPSIQP